MLSIPVIIDSDNALGAAFGDVDDGFAIAAAVKSGLPIEALLSVYGNTFESSVAWNHQVLLTACESSVPIFRGAAHWWSRGTKASNYLAGLDHEVRILALGPMTNISLALRKNENLAKQVSEIIFVGTNYCVPLPAFRFIDFNQWKHPKATRRILDSSISLTIIPCDVARALRVTEEEVGKIHGALGAHIQNHARRWFRRSKKYKGFDSVPLWDLVPAMYVIDPSLFEVVSTTADLGRMGQAVFGSVGGRPVRVVTGFEPEAVWNKFISLVGSKEAAK